MRNIFVVLLAGFILSFKIVAMAAKPTACLGSSLVPYTQNVLNEALSKSGPQRREILMAALLKIRTICDIEDDGSLIKDYLPEKVKNDIEMALGIENGHPSKDSSFISSAVAKIKKYSKLYDQTAKPASRCAQPETSGNIAAIYADRFHEKFLGFLNKRAKLELLHPHLIQSNLPSSAMIYVKVISNKDIDRDRSLNGTVGFVSANDTGWKEDSCL